MTDRTRTFLVALGVALLGGAAMYLTRGMGPGGTPESVLLVQLTWEVASTAIVGLAALAGYRLYAGRTDLRREYPFAFAAFLAAGLIGHAAGFVALAIVPPESFSIGSYPYAFTMMTLQEVVPFALGAFAGAAVGTFRAAGDG